MFPLTDAICEQARRSRDPRFDGRFYVGVLTTGSYCRPVCSARSAAKDKVRYFAVAAAAEDAGFRACPRCRPERAPRLPEWCLGSELVQRGLRLIDAGFLDEHPTGALAGRLGVSGPQLQRRFRAVLGTTPQRLASARRLQLARCLLEESRLPLQQVARQAGYRSVRRFNAALRAAFGSSPTGLRRGAGSNPAADELVFVLPVRSPYNARWVFEFHRRRALGVLEAVDGLQLRRRLPGSTDHWLTVEPGEDGLRVRLPTTALGSSLPVAQLLSQVRRVFDLDADPEVIAATLAGDEWLDEQLRRSPGLRVPGAWDGFELAVRAILGQQVSVERARVLAEALVERFGVGNFPSPAQLSDADVSAIGMPRRRGAAVRALAGAVESGALRLDDAQPTQALQERLAALPGIGPWTAGYIAMRVGRDADAFPDADWVVLKELGMTSARARKLAGRWRPWRAYALMYLWARSARFTASAFPLKPSL